MSIWGNRLRAILMNELALLLPVLPTITGCSQPGSSFDDTVQADVPSSGVPFPSPGTSIPGFTMCDDTLCKAWDISLEQLDNNCLDEEDLWPETYESIRENIADLQKQGYCPPDVETIASPNKRAINHLPIR